MNKEEMKLHNKVGDICSELRDGYVSNSNTHDLLYAVLELFESVIDKRLEWLSWFWELVSEDGLTEVLTEMLPEIEIERGNQLWHYVYPVDVLPRNVCCILKSLILDDALISWLFYLLRIVCWWSEQQPYYETYHLWYCFPMFLWLTQLEKALWLQYENLYVMDPNEKQTTHILKLQQILTIQLHQDPLVMFIKNSMMFKKISAREKNQHSIKCLLLCFVFLII